MSFIRRLTAVGRTLFHGRTLDDDLERELTGYLDILTDEKVAAGIAPEDARRAARIELAGIDQVKEEVRIARRGAWIESCWQDVRYGARLIARTKGASAAAVLTLAIGIGATTAIFTVANAVLLRPLPYTDPSRLLILGEKTAEFRNGSVAYPNYQDWRAQSRCFAGLAAFRFPQDRNFVGGAAAERVRIREVSHTFLATLGVRPFLGSAFSPADDRRGAAPTAIVSHRFWKARLHADPGAVGRPVRLDGATYSVAGVLPEGFWFYDAGVDVYVPIGLSDEMWVDSRENRAGMYVVARLAPGVSLASAQAEMDAVAANLARAYPDANAGHGVSMTPIFDNIVGNAGRTLKLMLAAVGFVLLIACANVANLRLARGSARQREMAIRTALGAGRARVIRQLLIESLLLALLGGAGGILLAWWGTGALVALVPDSLPRTDSLPLDGRVLAFALLASCLTGLVFGTAPALQAARQQADSLRERAGGTTLRRRRVQDALAACEVALALVLLAGAGLMLRTVNGLLHVDPGFQPSGIASFNVSLPPDQYATGEQVHRFYRRVEEALRAIPGVEAAAFSTDVPLREDSEMQLYVTERPKPRPDKLAWALNYITGPDYVDVMKLRLLRGRFIANRDVFASTHVVVIDEAFARGLFPGEDPIGKHVSFAFPGFDEPREIVGIVNHVKHWSLSTDGPAKVQYQIYIPHEQLPEPLYTNARNGLTISLRSQLPPERLEQQVADAVRRLDPSLPLFGFTTMGQVMRESIGTQRLAASLLAVFAICAFTLAAIGIYGVMACVVAQRVHEIGIRLALGARRSAIASLVVGRGLALTGVGIAAGIAAALALTRFLSSLLFGVAPSDPLTFGSASALLASVAAGACYLPARRAARVDPVVALRCE